MGKFLEFVNDNNEYCKYYKVFHILFYTKFQISEFCGLTIKDFDMEKRIINIENQLQRLNSMEYHIESTKTNNGKMMPGRTLTPAIAGIIKSTKGMCQRWGKNPI